MRCSLTQDRVVNSGRPLVQLCLILFRLAQVTRRSPLPVRILAPLAAGTYRAYAGVVLGIDLPTSTVVGPRLVIHHGYGIVISARARLGADVTLHHAVTIGVRRTGGRAPLIGSEVRIAQGASILGDVCVGAQASIGAHSLVVDDVPAGAVVTVSPAAVTVRAGKNRPAR